MTLILLRLLHIVLGVFWAGTMIFGAVFLEPSVRKAGPEGGKVMAQLIARRFMVWIPIVAATTILSGITLFWKVSAGFDEAWMASPLGRTLSVGAVFALVAFFIGIFVVRPSMLRAMAIMGSLPQITDDGEKAARTAEAQRIRRRGALAGRWVAALLVIAVAAMAIARYV